MLRSLLKAALVLLSVAAVLAVGGLFPGPAAAAAPPTPRPIGSTATFPHFGITVLQTAMDPEYHGFMVRLRVCVRSLPPGSTGGRTRISWDPWTVTAGGRTHRPSVQEDPPHETFPRPYRSEGRFRVGECAIGWLPFWSVKADDRVTSVDYHNALRNRARWRGGPWAIGSVATFDHFTVRVTAVDLREDWMGVRARICVRSVPKGSRTVRVSWDPWSLATARGVVRPMLDHVGDSVWSPRRYPIQTRLAKGQCRAGWLPFLRPRTEVQTIRYRNSLGDQASWRI